jgi:pro-apoptotic serine protease NMA111
VTKVHGLLTAPVFADFRLKTVTFDNVPWVITMKKNEHYFPMMEWIKDPAAESGWRQVTYENGKPVPGEGPEGILPVANFETDCVDGVEGA